MRRGFYVFFLLWLLIPETAHAILMLPSATVVIIVKAEEGDGSFDFQLTDGQLFSPIQNFNIATETGSGGYTAEVTFPSSIGYNLTQQTPAGWQLRNVSCISDNAGDTSYGIANGRHIFVSAFSTTTCTFTNVKLTVRNPVVFIPGITGTELYENASLLWPNPLQMAQDKGDQFMDALSFDNSLKSLKQITVGSVVRKIGINDNITFFDYSGGLLKEFEASGYREGVDLFTFPYDWRFGANEQNVQALKNKINNILFATGAEKVDVIAHSAGGILLKQYIYQNHDHGVGKAVFLGVPHLGAPKAIKTLLEGDSLDIPVLSAAEIKKIARNMPAMYQLTPSAEYQNKAGAFFSTHTQNLFSSSDHDFGFTELQNYLTTSKDLNGAGFGETNRLHNQSLDTFDPREKGVDVYNIIGCQQATVGKIIERKTDNLVLRPVVNGLAVKFVPGDGTVPLVSSESLQSEPENTFYALNANHGKMPSQDGIRQQLVRLITGQNTGASGITRDRNACKFNGKAIAIYSPLVISAIDDFGNITQVTEEGEIQTDIPGSNLEVLGDHKFLFLPDGQDYQISVTGTGEGTFTLVNENISAGEVVKREVFADVPVDAGQSGSLDLEAGNLVLEGQLITPSYELASDEIEDHSSPVTEISPMGRMGQVGYYRSDVSISMSAADDNSGLWKTQYILDDGELITYTQPLVVTEEGAHTVTYFSTDKAGNMEGAKTLEFTIDKTAPEFVIHFDATKRDLSFSGGDSVVDSDDSVTISDQAGNTSKIILKEKDRKKKLKAEIKQLFYNGQEVDISKNVIKLSWQYAKDGSLKNLDQQVKSKKDFNVSLNYDGQKTVISGKDALGKINKTIIRPIRPIGPIGLIVRTDRGDLNWSY